MKKLLVIVIYFIFFTTIYSQDCYIKNKDILNNDFSYLWNELTYQGTIGDSNQRIQVRFNSVSKVNDTLYIIIPI